MLAVACWLAFLPTSYALEQSSFVETTASRGSFPVAQRGAAATIYVDATDWPGVIRAADDLKQDVNRVTSLTPKLTGTVAGL